MPAFRKLLVANRGEIACRLLKTATAMGYQTVAVYSDADVHAVHTRMAQEAVRIGPGPAAESYLAIEAVLQAARLTGADAVHPGYGFLAENAAFAQACQDAGLVFVGPSPEAIASMGDKAQAKRIAREAGVPVVPGVEGALDAKSLTTAADDLGYPLLLKATWGGGGRGIRRVDQASQLEAAYAQAQAEAQGAFGQAAVMLERLVPQARHIEVQIAADRSGKVVVVGDRECSVQRRRQKLIEEAPAPGLSPALRAAIWEAATALTQRVRYEGVGTVELLLDGEGQFYFLEMNTRLQVEHGVTELVTGLDLVRLQLEIAEGRPLPFQSVQSAGHALEARLCAEDPYAEFAPQTGTVAQFAWREPACAAGVRVDSGVEQDSEVPPFYDSLLAKLLVRASSRHEAARRLQHVLAEAPVFGLRTNAAFLCNLLASADLLDREFHTELLARWREEGHPAFSRPAPSRELWAVATACLLTQSGGAPLGADTLPRTVHLACDDAAKSLRCVYEGGQHRVEVDGEKLGVEVVEAGERTLQVQVCSVTRRIPWRKTDRGVQLAQIGYVFDFLEASKGEGRERGDRSGRITAQLAGVMHELCVAEGDSVEPGQVLCVIESMKMHTRVLAKTTGRVVTIPVTTGQRIRKDTLLMELSTGNEET